MRGDDQQQNHILEARVRKDHPLRAIRAMVDEVLAQLSRRPSSNNTSISAKSSTTMWLFVVATGMAILLGALQRAGNLLLVQQLNKADVIVVLGGDVNDRRYWKGVELLQRGYGRELLVDAVDQTTMFGRTYADWAQWFIAATNPGEDGKVKVCPIGSDSTVAETKFVQVCLASFHPQSILLVTSDFHTRRALSIFTNRLPMYRWYIAAANDPAQFNTNWWRQRQWAKNTYAEWQKLMWWELVERWL